MALVDGEKAVKPDAVTLRGTSKAGSESATNTSEVLSDTPMTRPAKDSGGDAFSGVIDSTSDVGPGSSDDSDSTGHDSFSLGFGNTFGDDDDEIPVGDADEHALGFSAPSDDYGDLGVDLSPWPPLLAMLDSTEPEASPDYRPFTPTEGVERAHALELRAESMRQYAERGAVRTGELDRTEVGDSDDNRDVVAGRDRVEVDGMLDEHTGHGLVVVADDVEMNVRGRLRQHAHLEDNIIMGGVMTDESSGGTFITAAMSDDMAVGLGLRCTAPLDLWVHGLVGMEERPGTCVADGVLLELAGTLYEREYGPSAHVAAVARFQGTTATTMKTGFRPLMKTALGVRNLIPGGGGGGGQASASPPAAPPPAPPGGEAGAATLTAAEGGGALGRGVAGGDDTDEIASLVRTVDSASDADDVENLQHPASTADNLDDLARVDVEGEGYQQVAEIYEQPLPASAAPEPDAAPGSGSDSAAAGSGYKKAPELDLTAPGAEGYDFENAYGPLREQVEHYRADSNWRGNMAIREYLQGIDAKATELFEGLGGDAAAIAGDNRGYRTSNIYAAMEQMASQAEAAGELEELAKIQDAMAQLEEFVQGQLVEVAARTDEFAGTALGSQRLPIDSNIDVDKLRNWLEDQVRLAEEQFGTAQSMEEAQRASWTRDYYDQLLKSLNAGMNPLAESSEQTIFIQVTKVDAFNEQYTAQAAADLAALGLDPDEFAIIPPRAPDQDQLDVYLALHDGFVETLSGPELHRSAEEVGDSYMAALHNPAGPGPDLDGPDSLHPLGGVDEPDVNPVLGDDAPPSTPPLDRTRPGTDGYDFRKSYGSLNERNQYYREQFNFRGNFFLREYLREIDNKAMALFQGLDGTADAVGSDNFGYFTSSVYHTLEQMADEAEAAGEVNRAADLRAGMAEIEEIVNGTIAEVALRADEFSGAVPWSPRSPIDRNIDIARVRSWLDDQAQQARARLLEAETDEARQLAGWEWGYYTLMIQSLDEGVNPLAVSNEQIAILRINQGQPSHTQYAEDVAAAAAQGHELVGPEEEAVVYARLQELLVATVSSPEFHLSPAEMGADTFIFPVRGPIDATLDLPGADSLRPLDAGDIAPPLPAADFAESAGYVDEVRDRSFSRSALEASEETLERQAAGFAEGDASVWSRAPEPGTGAPEPSPGSRGTPPDSAQAPTIDQRSGGWVVEPPEEPRVSPAPSDDASSVASDVSWESGLQSSDDSEIDFGDVDPWEPFNAVSEPEDVDLEGVDGAQHAPDADDGAPTGSTTARSGATGGEDANPTGTLSGPDDSPTASRRGNGTEPGPSGTASRITPGTPDPVSTGTAPGSPGPPVPDATPAGASASDADAGAAGTRSHLYDEPVSFEGRSLEGTPLSDDTKELAQSLDGAEIPVEDLPPVEPGPAEPATRPILKHSGDTPDPGLSYVDEDEAIINRRVEYASSIRDWSSRDTDSVWRRARNRKEAVDAANARWSELAATQRTSATSFSDDPRQVLYLVEHETTLYSEAGEKIVDLYRGADPPNTLDRSQAAHYVPKPWDWEPARDTGFGRFAQGWNEFPFSPREQIVNALSKGEALSPEQIAALESGLEGYRAAGGTLSSTQHRAMVDMISDLGDQYRHARWSMEGERGERLLQLIEMLDFAAVVV